MLSCSIGSLGMNGAYDTVEEIHVQDCSFTGTQNGIRIKTWQVWGFSPKPFIRLFSWINSRVHISIFCLFNLFFYNCSGRVWICQEDLIPGHYTQCSRKPYHHRPILLSSASLPKQSKNIKFCHGYLNTKIDIKTLKWFLSAHTLWPINREHKI